MNILQCIILGIVQGATEFLPVSSSGHLLLAYRIMGIPNDLSYTLSLHIATLAAVFVAMRKEILALIKRPICKQTGLILLTSLPTAIIAAIVYFLDVDLQFAIGDRLCRYRSYAVVFGGFERQKRHICRKRSYYRLNSRLGRITRTFSQRFNDIDVSNFRHRTRKVYNVFVFGVHSGNNRFVSDGCAEGRFLLFSLYARRLCLQLFLRVCSL